MHNKDCGCEVETHEKSFGANWHVLLADASTSERPPVPLPVAARAPTAYAASAPEFLQPPSCGHPVLREAARALLHCSLLKNYHTVTCTGVHHEDYEDLKKIYGLLVIRYTGSLVFGGKHGTNAKRTMGTTASTAVK